MLKEIQKNLEKFNMVSPQDRLLVGVSGGADSVCLLLVLYALGREMDFSVEAVHVEHGIRGQESLEDAAFVEDLCRRMQVSLSKVSVDVPAYSRNSGIGMEEAARILRYEAFAKLAEEKSAKVALAHHMEDNAETILFQLIRGSSLGGLCGMQPVRVDKTGVTYIRPLLSVHRKEIEAFLQTRGMGYRVDSTNAHLDYSRNFLRGVVLPELEKVNEQAVAHINAAALHLTDIRDFLETETGKAWEQVVRTAENESSVGSSSLAEEDFSMGRESFGKPPSNEETEISMEGTFLEKRASARKNRRILVLDTERLATLHPAVQKEIAYRAIAEMLGAKKDISAVHVQDLLELCRKQSGKELHLPGGLLAKKEYSHVKLSHVDKTLRKKKDNFIENGQDNPICISGGQLEQCGKSLEPMEVSIGDTGEYLRIRIFPYYGKNFEIPQKTYTKWFDYDMIKDGFCIRTCRSGDAFTSDAFGHRKKLKRYFIDEKIPASHRARMWLLAQGQTVLWLIGGRISEHIKVTEDTKTIMEITYFGGN